MSCSHPEVIEEAISYVHGTRTYYEPDCEKARGVRGVCGESGKFWEEEVYRTKSSPPRQSSFAKFMDMVRWLFFYV
jgi:hypothetical protein